MVQVPLDHERGMPRPTDGVELVVIALAETEEEFSSAKEGRVHDGIFG